MADDINFQAVQHWTTDAAVSINSTRLLFGKQRYSNSSHMGPGDFQAYFSCVEFLHNSNSCSRTQHHVQVLTSPTYTYDQIYCQL